MSPKYEIEVNHALAKGFEEWAKAKGVEITRKAPSQRDERDVTAALWQQQRTSAAASIAMLRHPVNPKADLISENGITNFMVDVFRKYPIFIITSRIRSALKETREALSDIFTKNLPEQLPDDVVLHRDSSGKNLLSQLPGFAKHEPLRILPRHVEALIKLYGLDGIPKKSPAQIGRELGVSSGAISLNVASTLWCAQQRLSQDPRLQSLVLKDISQ